MKATRTGLGAVAAVMGCSVFAVAPAMGDHDGFRLTIGAQRAGVWVPPVYENRPRTITVPALYEDVARQVWREPVYETQRVAIEVPARTVSRKVPRYSDCGEFLGWTLVEEVIEPARTEWRTERVCVREGYYETVTERVRVREATTGVVWEQVLVRPGHWESPSRWVIGKDRPYPLPHRARHIAGFGHAGLNVRLGE